MLGSIFVFFYLFVFRMISPVHFYNEFLFNTNKINDVIPDDVLSVEFDGRCRIIFSVISSHNNPPPLGEGRGGGYLFSSLWIP